MGLIVRCSNLVIRHFKEIDVYDCEKLSNEIRFAEILNYVTWNLFVKTPTQYSHNKCF